MKIFNYFSYGIPVIGTDLPTIKEIVTDKGGIFYEPGNIEQLITAINQLNSSQQIFNKYSNYILKRAEELLWEKRGRKILEFINQID
jgi:glycosyltransferase involved in cell wall biosynthesis